jgi:hypothetical protein
MRADDHFRVRWLAVFFDSTEQSERDSLVGSLSALYGHTQMSQERGKEWLCRLRSARQLAL